MAAHRERVLGGIRGDSVNTLDYIVQKFKLNPDQRQPVEIPNTDRNTLASLFGELGFKMGAEIGVELGIYAETLCKRNPGVHLYAVDAWAAYAGYRDHVSQGKLDGFYEQVKERLAPYHCELIREFSMDAVKRFAPNSLDFVYIDANHEFRYVAEDLAEWSKVVRPGGIVAGHDYCKRTVSQPYSCHVVEVVQAYTQAYHIRPWFVLGSKDIREGELRDRPRSWMWVKQ